MEIINWKNFNVSQNRDGFIGDGLGDKKGREYWIDEFCQVNSELNVK